MNAKNYKAVVTTVPFGEIDPLPLTLMKDVALDYTINPLGRKLRPEEVADVIADHDIVIAGTEPITAEVMEQCPNLKAICRVGIGLDSVDLVEARKRNIAVSYTPDGPSPAVAELTVGLMLDLLRSTTKADRDIRAGIWHRKAGRRLGQCKVGIIGCGRIGSRVIKHLYHGFEDVQIFADDLLAKPELDSFVTWASKEDIYKQCDIVSLHVPLTPETMGMIGETELASFKDKAVLINTARGGIVEETDLAKELREGKLFGAAMDVFEEEPYKGELCELDNVLLTCHLGSMTEDCRARMEIEATQEAVRFALGQELQSVVPQAEYEMAERLAANQ